MSWRHAEKPITDAAETNDTKNARARRLFRNGGHLSRIERLEEPPRCFEIELRVARLDADEESVAARQGEARNVEHRVIRLRQAVQRQHPEHRGQRRGENRALE